MLVVVVDVVVDVDVIDEDPMTFGSRPVICKDVDDTVALGLLLVLLLSAMVGGESKVWVKVRGKEGGTRRGMQ